MTIAMRNGFWQFAYDWQNLAAGLLALAAGFVAYRGARDQANVAKDQIALSQKTERRRMVREGYAFAETLRASMALVIEEADEARKLVPSLCNDDAGDSPQAYDARRRITKTGFADLRTAFIRLGGELTEPFLRLDALVNHFGAQWFTQKGVTSDAVPRGRHRALRDELERISKLATCLMDEAIKERERCKKILIRDEN